MGRCRDGVPGRCLLEVVGDDRFQLGHAGQAALDKETAAARVGGDVDQAHDAEDALAVDDALTGADGVAGEFDALVGLAGAALSGDHGHDGPPFQVALDP